MTAVMTVTFYTGRTVASLADSADAHALAKRAAQAEAQYREASKDLSKKRRTIEIRVKPSDKRRGEKYQLAYKTSYALKPGK